jgi:hypothetical protein
MDREIGLQTICSAYSRISLTPIAWNVPVQMSAFVMMVALGPVRNQLAVTMNIGFSRNFRAVVTLGCV